MGKFIKVIEGGVVRFDFEKTPAEYDGVYTDDLQTCVVIIIMGSKGMAVIHDTDKLRPIDIKKEFQLLGDIKFWTTAFYPKSDEENSIFDPKMFAQMHPNGIFQSHIKRLQTILREIDPNLLAKYQPREGKTTIPRDCKYHSAPGRFVSVTRQGEVNTSTMPANIVNPKNASTRLLINRINQHNVLETSKGRNNPDQALSPIDVQFDGENFTQNPAVEAAYNSTMTLINNHPAARSISSIVEDIYTNLRRELQLQYRTTDQLPAADTTLRRAAVMDQYNDVKTLIHIFPDIIDKSDNNPESKRTALHWAISKNHYAIAKLLLKKGARVDIADGTGKTVRETINESDNPNIQDLKNLLPEKSVPTVTKRP